MSDPFKVFGSIFTAIMVCLMAATAAQADDTKSGEIIETEFAPAPVPSDGLSPPAPGSSLPDAVLPLQLVPAELIGDLQPADPQLQLDRTGGGGVASSDGGGPSNDSGGGSSSDGGSGGGDSGGGGHGNGHGKGGSKQ